MVYFTSCGKKIVRSDCTEQFRGYREAVRESLLCQCCIGQGKQKLAEIIKDRLMVFE